MPTGMVSDSVLQSWARCQRLHASPSRNIEFAPVTASRAQLALQKNRQLRDVWSQELPELEAMLAATSCAAMLTDATGVLIGSTCTGRAHENIMPTATRIGVSLSEEAVGTTAPGVVARTGQAVTVDGGEHFFEHVKPMHCAAAPIRDINGRLAGVLDISSEGIPFSFDAAAVVGIYSGSIENRLLIAQSQQHLVIRFQVASTLLDSPAVGLVGIDSSGRLAWRNGAASKLLGLAAFEMQSQDVELTLGNTFAQLASLPESGAAPLRFPNGLLVWARAEMCARDGRRKLIKAHAVDASVDASVDTSVELHRSAPVSPSTANAPLEPLSLSPIDDQVPDAALAKASLRELDLDVIDRALDECGGNVSAVAKKLAVSRGLIYRRLKLRDTVPE
jgi:transcriptional regulator of acetoin/glycerol metabolism